MPITVANIHSADKSAPTLYIGREKGKSHHFGNPFTHLPQASTLAAIQMPTREDAIQAFGDWLDGSIQPDLEPQRRLWIIRRIDEIAHQNTSLTLLCFCHPEHCHGDIIAARIRGIRQQCLASSSNNPFYTVPKGFFPLNQQLTTQNLHALMSYANSPDACFRLSCFRNPFRKSDLPYSICDFTPHELDHLIAVMIAFMTLDNIAGLHLSAYIPGQRPKKLAVWSTHRPAEYPANYPGPFADPIILSLIAVWDNPLSSP